MAETLAELRKLSDEEVIERHDALAKNTQPGTAHYLAEIARRDQDRPTRTINRLTCGREIQHEIHAAFRILFAHHRPRSNRCMGQHYGRYQETQVIAAAIHVSMQKVYFEIDWVWVAVLAAIATAVVLFVLLKKK